MEINDSNEANENPEVSRTRYNRRKLQRVADDEDAAADDDNSNPTSGGGGSRKIRHRKKVKKYGGERFGNAAGGHVGDRESIAGGRGGVALQFGTGDVAQSAPAKPVAFKNASNVTDETVTRKLDLHANCYTTNEVLEIIAFTCLVNFIFWFAIISCVNFYTKKQIVKYQSWDSLESSGIASELEPKPKKKARRNPDSTEEFAASMTDDEELENKFLIPVRDDAADRRHWRMLGYFSRSECDDDGRAEWNLFGGNRPGRLSGERHITTGSHSMENLIF